MVAFITKKDNEGGKVALRIMNPVPSVKPAEVPAGEAVVDGANADSSPKTTNPKATTSKTTKRNRPRNKRNTSNVPDSFSKGSRGIDTLLRNAYRAQLDMLALAATKANIMISLNGLLMSMLIIAGTTLITINGMYVIPIGIFLVTCAVATTFAVFAARPEISRKKFSYGEFMRDEARLMVFEEFSDLHESEYIDAMTAMLNDPERTYRGMLAHIYDLGKTADKKYRHLYYSYTTFMAGTIVTVIALFTLAALRWSGVLILT